MLHRNVIIVGLLQLITVYAGFVALAIVLKASGYPEDPPFPGGLAIIRWSPLALWLRHYGLFLLLAGPMWIACASASLRRRGFLLSFELWLILGIALSTMTICVFLLACVFRYKAYPA